LIVREEKRRRRKRPCGTTIAPIPAAKCSCQKLTSSLSLSRSVCLMWNFVWEPLPLLFFFVELEWRWRRSTNFVASKAWGRTPERA
jgi:hypothetical protein